MKENLKSIVGYSRENDCYFVKVFPFPREMQAKAYANREDRIITPEVLESAARAIWEGSVPKDHPFPEEKCIAKRMYLNAARDALLSVGWKLPKNKEV